MVVIDLIQHSTLLICVLITVKKSESIVSLRVHSCHLVIILIIEALDIPSSHVPLVHLWHHAPAQRQWLCDTWRSDTHIQKNVLQLLSTPALHLTSTWLHQHYTWLALDYTYTWLHLTPDYNKIVSHLASLSSLKMASAWPLGLPVLNKLISWI